ncbi:311_t:CDS:2, partial [Ambispora gerdemannii]
NRPAINKVIQALKEIVWSLPESNVFVSALSSDVSSESSDSCEEYYCGDSENLASFHEKLSTPNASEIIVDNLFELLNKQLYYTRDDLTVGRSLHSYYQQNAPDSFDIYALSWQQKFSKSQQQTNAEFYKEAN